MLACEKCSKVSRQHFAMNIGFASSPKSDKDPDCSGTGDRLATRTFLPLMSDRNWS